MTLKYLLFLTLFFGLFVSFYLKAERPEKINQNDRSKNDTSYYHVYIGIERGVTEEIIKTYNLLGQARADIKTIKYLKFSYVGVPTTIQMLDSFQVKSIHLTKSQIDTLENFSKMVTQKNVRHNQGIKFAGRIGIYKTVINGDTTKFESRELYNLSNALGYDRE